MGFWSDLKVKVLETCLKYGEQYDEICQALIEDINQYNKLYDELSKKIKFRRKGGGED